MPLPLELGSIHDPSVRRAFEQLSMQFPITVTGGGGGGAPSGPAGGDLSGTYPNPSIATGVIVDGDISATAAIAKSKLAALAIVNADVDAAAAIAESKLNLATDAAAGTGSRRTLGTGATQAAAGNDARFTDARAPTGAAGGDLSGTYPNPQIGTGVIVNADVSGTAAIARSKLDFGSGLVNADIAAAAAIAKTKLASLDVVNADVNAAAAIDESKLNLATDAAAGTGSRRTLGTTSTSAAAGNRGLPTGGTSGQVLAKNSATDYDAGWVAAGGSPSTVLTQYKTITQAATALATQAGAATLLSTHAGSAVALGGAGTALWAFYLDPADLNFTGTTNKMRLRTSLHCNAVAPTGTITGSLNPVATWGGASGSSPTIATLGAAVLSNAYATPAANSHTRTDSADINFPTAGWYTFVITNSAAMAAGSSCVINYELQARQI